MFRAMKKLLFYKQSRYTVLDAELRLIDDSGMTTDGDESFADAFFGRFV